MRSVLAASAVLLFLAGCATPATDPAPGENEAAPATMTWSVEDCTAAVAVVPVPASAFAGRLPDVFRLLAPTEIGLPPDPRGDAVLGLEAFRCATGTAGNETFEDIPHGGIFTFVEPPVDLADPDVDFYSFYRWDTVIGAPSLRALLADAGAPVFDGEATMTTVPAPQAGGPMRAELSVNGTSFAFTGAAHAPSGSTGGTFKEFFAVPGGYATWKVSGIAPFGQGGGTVQASGGLAEEILGAEPVPGYVLFFSGMSFVDGIATVPTTSDA